MVLTVNDPLLAEAAHATGRGDWLERESMRELRHFCAETIGADADCELLVSIGGAADEILSTARTRAAAGIVMGAQGITGLRKAFFGSTAERVLRDTTVPVLITPTDCHAPVAATDLSILIRRIVVPVDLTAGSDAQAQIAATIGRALHVPLLLVHAVEPLATPLKWRSHLPHVDMERRDRAERAILSLRDRVGAHYAEVLVPFGEASEEIAKATRVRGAGLIVMNLQTSQVGRVGSVTYRVLSLAHVPVLALPACARADLAERTRAVEQATT
jgi:nucleotide-binding universal stress UspA family protein